MRVSFVLSSKKDIRGKIIAHIRTIERVFSMEATSVDIHPQEVQGLSCNDIAITSDEILRMVENWNGSQEFHVLLEFREMASDE